MKRRTRRRSSPGSRLLKEYLIAVGWTQQQLAQACGMHPTAVNHFLSGHRLLTLHAALLFEKGTTAAREAGLVAAEPLTMRRLMPELFATGAIEEAGAAE